MPRLKNGPLDGKEVREHVNYEQIYFEQPWMGSAIYLTPAIGRVIYKLDGGIYWFSGYIEKEPEELAEGPTHMGGKL